MRKIDRRVLSLGVALLLGAAFSVSSAFAGPDPEPLRRTFLDLINAERARLDLQPLALDPALTRAAQSHADDMTARQTVAFSTGDGKQVEDWARAAGYTFQLVTAKLATTPEPPEALARGWAEHPESNRNSLLHPDVRDLGVGIGEVRGTPVYSFVLARSEKSYLDRYVAELYERQTLALQNLDNLRKELLLRVNEARAGAKRELLARHPALERAAQLHAEAVLATIRDGRPLKEAGPLALKVKQQRYRAAGAIGAIGERIVVDALTPEQAMSALLDTSGGRTSNLLGGGYTQMGIGVAFERTPEGFRVVWVQCLARPASMPTTANALEEPKEGL